MEIMLLTLFFVTVSIGVIVYVNFKHDPWFEDYNKFIDFEKTLEELEFLVLEESRQLAEEFEETTRRG